MVVISDNRLQMTPIPDAKAEYGNTKPVFILLINFSLSLSLSLSLSDVVVVIIIRKLASFYYFNHTIVNNGAFR